MPQAMTPGGPVSPPVMHGAGMPADPRHPSVVSASNSDLLKENEYLRKKVKYLQHVGGVYREKFGQLLRGAAKSDPKMSSLHAMYVKLVEEMRFDAPQTPNSNAQHDSSFSHNTSDIHLRDVSPSRRFSASGSSQAPPPESQEGQYWHGKFLAATQKIKSLLTNAPGSSCENQLAEDIQSLQVQLSRKEDSLNELQGVMDQQRAELDALRRAQVMSPVRRQEELAVHEQRAMAEADSSTQIILKSMKEDNLHLSAQLHESLERLRTVDVIQQDNALLQKQNTVLRSRIQKMKTDQSSMQQDNSATVVDMQSNISTLLSSLNKANEEIADRDVAISEIQASKDDLLRDMQAMHHVVTTYKDRLTSMEQNAVAKMKAEQVQLQEKEKEKTVLHAQVIEGESTVSELTGRLNELQVQVETQVTALKENSYHIEILNMEKLSLSEKVKQLDMLLSERRSFALILGEVQSRLQGAVTELHTVQSTSGVADRMRELNQTISSLETLESQIKQKDDTLALKDDEIRRLKDAMGMLEDSINSISSLFLKMPRSVGDVERLIIERDVFKDSVLDCHHHEGIELLEEKIEICLLERQSQTKAKADEAAAERAPPTAHQMLLEGLGIDAKGMNVDVQNLMGLVGGQPAFAGLQDDSDDDLMQDPNPRSASTLGDMYESIYGANKAAVPAVGQGALPEYSTHPTHVSHQHPTPSGSVEPHHVMRDVRNVMHGCADGSNASYTYEQDTPPPAAGMKPVSATPQTGAVPPPGVMGASVPVVPPPPAPHPTHAGLSGNDIVHAFRAFERDGVMDKDHFKTCVLALGLTYAVAAEDYLSYHAALDLDTFRHAILLCQS